MQPYFIPKLLVRSRALAASLILAGCILPAQADRPGPALETATVMNSGSGCTPFHALSAYQVGSEIWVTTVLEDYPGGCVAAVFNLTRPIEIAGPAILARNVGELANNQALRDERNAASASHNYQLLSRYGNIENTYDPALGDGWAETNSIGWVYVRQLPYIYSPLLGWLYYQAGPVIQRTDLNPMNGTDAMGKAETTLFYLWSESRGWLLTYSDSYGDFYDIDDDIWWNIAWFFSVDDPE